ncbi:MAG TPA: gas vesicle protein GvpG [Trichocoleus sp.]
MLLKLLFLPIAGPLGGVTWIAEKILEQSEGETNDLEVLQKQLLALQMAFDMGEVEEEEFEAQEEELLLAIEALQKQTEE